MLFREKIIEENDQLRRYRIIRGGAVMSFGDVITAWREDEDFCRFYSRLVTASTWPAVYWEHPPVQHDSLDMDYEFSLRLAGALAGIAANQRAYASYFNDQPVVSFPSLRKDAVLVVPTPENGNTDYAHLLSFLRTAEWAQQRAMWELVGEEMAFLVEQRPVYLSTHGTGVAWLHIRLDSRPKYYGDGRYKHHGIDLM